MTGLYLWVDLAVLIIPLAASFEPKMRFVTQWRDFWPTNLAVMGFFVAWDAWFTSEGIWSFNPQYLLGPELFGLPMEEWLFFICIPYACVFTYASLKHSVKRNPFENASLTLGVSGTILCGILCFQFYDAWYTFSASLLTGLFLAWMTASFAKWAKVFWLTYFVILFPFVITNGVLTGITFWDYPILHNDSSLIRDFIVWYSPEHNTGWRIFSMPIDDLIYGCLLIGMHIAGFEFLQNRRLKKGAQEK
jgi:lycopene cyclase domain-containing protein